MRIRQSNSPVAGGIMMMFTTLVLTAMAGLVSAQLDNSGTSVQIAGIMNTNDLDWIPKLWDFVFDSLREDWFLDLFPSLRTSFSQSSVNLTHTLRNSDCDATTAVRSYWDVRTGNPDDMPPHAVIGAYCSGASISLARISGLEDVPQLSPFSTSSALSDTEEFPFFARMLAPDDDGGEVGALVAALKLFGWTRVSIISTDRPFAKSWESEFRDLWSRPENAGIVEYSNTVRTNLDGTINEESVRQAIEEIPTDHPEKNSRVILLAAHSEHAFPIMEVAQALQRQPDTIWVGPSAWVGKDLETLEGGYPAWLPDNPGFLGVVPSQNEQGSRNQKFLSKFQDYQRQRLNEAAWDVLPSFAPQLIDAIVALTMALLQTPENELRNGSLVWNALRRQAFEGISGSVSFSSVGDLANPSYSIQQLGDGGTWNTVGVTSNMVGTATTESNAQFCFPVSGCVTNLGDVPSDSYPIPRDKALVGAIVASVVILCLLIIVSFKLWRRGVTKRLLKEELNVFRDSVVGMRTATNDYLPNMANTSKHGDIEQPLTPKNGLLKVEPKAKVVWCWKETPSCMPHHSSDVIEGDPADCWIRYKDDSNVLLETAFQDGTLTSCSPLVGYTVDFLTMKQTKQKTGFTRKVQRLVVEPPKTVDPPKTIDLSKATIADPLPADLTGEPQMVLLKGDIVQISKQRKDGWAFGTKLHHQDEAIAREMVAYTTSTYVGDEDDANVFSDTGWFQLDVTELPSADDLQALQNKVGDTGALEKPKNWADVVDPTVAEQHKLSKDDPEYQAVSQAFLSTLQNRSISSLTISRVQNLSMWQSYVVKRQTMCYQESQNQAKKSGNDDGKNDAAQLKRSMERFERRWLWHGTNVEVKDKILQQGFNRSFCGKNATMYGKGVYFARDASYSSYKTYAQPDSKGVQYILACRVVVGEYCVGRKDILTPDVRDAKSQTLYDSTVGLLTNDTMANPSIYVTYHDAQAYPEYVITFKQENVWNQKR